MCATRALALALCTTLIGCAVNPAPPGVLPREEAIGSTGYGAWAYVVTSDNSVVEGELIAASDDTLWVFGITVALNSIPRDIIMEAKLGLFAARTSGLTTWMALGTLSTIGNGAFLLLTAPMWLIGGTAALRQVYRQPVYDWKKTEPLSSFAQFARFPGGIPADLDRSTLRSHIVIPRQ